MSTRLTISKQFLHRHRHLKPQNPSITTALRRLSAAPEEDELSQSAITQLKTTDDWTNFTITNTNLHRQLRSLSPQSLLKITRQLETSTKALKLLRFIHGNNPSLSPLSLSSIFQVIVELAIHGEDSTFSSIVDLLKISKEHKVPLMPNSVILLIRYFFRARSIQQSMLVYDDLDPDAKNTHVKNALIDVLLKSYRFNEACQVLDEMLEPDAKFPPDENTLQIVFPVFLRSNWGNESEEIVGLIRKFGVHGVFPDDVWLTRLITKLLRSFGNDKVWDVLHELMKFCNVRAGPCNVLLSGLVKERNYERLNLFLQEMKEKNIQPDVVTFGMLVNHLCKCRRVDEALDVLKKMREGIDGISVKPDVVLYNTLIDGLCKMGRQEEGLVLMEQMKSEDHCIPNAITYNSLIDGFFMFGEIERCQELFDQMNREGVEPDVVTVRTMIKGMCKHGQISNAMEFFGQMQEEIDLKGDAVSYSMLISSLCNVNNIEKAMGLFEKMVSFCSPDANVYQSLISGLTQAGRMDDASLVASKMKKAGFQLDLAVCNTLIGGFCNEKRIDKAIEVLRDMEETEVKANSVTWNTLISYFTHNRDFKTAYKFFRKMGNDGNAPTIVTYGTLIHAYCLAGNLDEAMSIFQEMLITSKVPPNTGIHNILIVALCKHGNVENALSLMDEMLQRGVRPNSSTYTAIFKGLRRKNWLKEALRLMDQMRKEGCNPDSITIEILTDWLSEVGQDEKLRSFVQGHEVSNVTAASTA